MISYCLIIPQAQGAVISETKIEGWKTKPFQDDVFIGTLGP